MINLNSRFQVECYNRALNKNEFLIAAKCRFGKTYVATKLVHDGWNSNITFILSGLNVRNEWRKALIDGGYIEGKTLFTTNEELHNLDYNAIPKNENVAIFISLQKANVEVRNEDLTLFNFFNSFEGTKTIVVDEAHFGEQTEKSQFILNNCHTDKVLYLSATPYTDSIDLKFDDEHKYCFTYLQEQKAFEEGLLEYTPIRLNLRVVNKYIEITDNDTIEDWDYLYNIKNKDILNGFIENSIINGVRKLHRHNILIICDRIKNAQKLAALLNKYENVKAIDVWDEGGLDSATATAFYKNEPEDLNFITTVGRLGTGSTIKPLDCVLYCCNTKSAIKFIQTSMRACSYDDENPNKTSADVVVFNKFGAYEVYRTIASLEHNGKEKASNNKNDIEDLQRYLPIFIEDDCGFKEIDYAEITDFDSLYVKGKTRLFDFITDINIIKNLPLFEEGRKRAIRNIGNNHPGLDLNKIKEAADKSPEQLVNLLANDYIEEALKANPDADINDLTTEAYNKAYDEVEDELSDLEVLRKKLECNFVGLIEDLENSGFINENYTIKFNEDISDYLIAWGLTLDFVSEIAEERPEYISSIAKLVRIENN